jgi:glycosyltransferase involved in cell wall biosynthesis
MFESSTANLGKRSAQPPAAGGALKFSRALSGGRTLGAKREAIKLACTTVYDVNDRGGFGSRTYYQLQAIRSQVRAMHFIGPLSHIRPVAPLLLAKREFYRRVRGKSYHPKRDRLMVQDYSRQIARHLAKLDANIVFSPLSPCSQPIAYLDCVQPIVIWTDTVWAAVVDFYPEYSSKLICKETLRDAIANERAALSRAALAIYWSGWAAQSAIRYYGLDPTKVRVVTPGPAVDDKDTIGLDEARRFVGERPRNRCRLLFVGIDWIRKGGDKALEVAKLLNASGIATELVVVGCEPQVDGPLPEFVRVIGHLSRSSEGDAAKLNFLYKISHFLIMPTRADCTPVVLLEANAFALPALTTNAGGIPEIVKCNINGITLPLSAEPIEYSKFIANLMQHYDEYEELALSAFKEFQIRLNNRTAAAAVLSLIEELL